MKNLIKLSAIPGSLTKGKFLSFLKKGGLLYHEAKEDQKGRGAPEENTKAK
jgi:hypothetical protein